MSILDGYGHLTSGDFERARPLAYYVLGNARISLSADNEWRTALERIGAVEVDRATFENADPTKEVRHE